MTVNGVEVGSGYYRDPLAEEELRALCHDLRQPLAVILVLASSQAESADLPESARRALARITEQAESMVALVRSTLGQGGDHHPVGLTALAREVVDSHRATWPGAITCSYGEDNRAVVHGCPALLRRALANLVDNATRAAGPDGHVRVVVKASAGFAELVVDDDGPGFGRIPRGTGLGLEVVRSATAQHSGTFTLGESRSGGVSARLRLPLPRQGD